MVFLSVNWIKGLGLRLAELIGALDAHPFGGRMQAKIDDNHEGRMRLASRHQVCWIRSRTGSLTRQPHGTGWTLAIFVRGCHPWDIACSRFRMFPCPVHCTENKLLEECCQAMFHGLGSCVWLGVKHIPLEQLLH